jgi:hypothetical protein
MEILDDDDDDDDDEEDDDEDDSDDDEEFGSRVYGAKMSKKQRVSSPVRSGKKGKSLIWQ